MAFGSDFPVQALPFKSKGPKWRKKCMDWAANRTYFNYSPIRKDVVRMKINYDLVNGVIHMDDMVAFLNPSNVSTITLPDKIQHFPIMNSKLNTLRGEEGARPFRWRAIVTNPNAISQIEEEKKRQFDEAMRQIVENTDLTPEEAEKQMKDTVDYFNYTWQDIREIRPNEVIRHYSKEQGFKQIFNNGFMDACIVNTEVYLCDIIGGEPVLMKLNPMKLRVIRSGYSNRIEDADILIYEDYWSPGRVVDTYYDELSEKNIKRLTDELPEIGNTNLTGAAGNYNEAAGFINRYNIVGDDGIMLDRESGMLGVFDELSILQGGIGSDLLPYDVAGNVRVIRLWWKSRRKIYKVKSFDPVTGEENFDFYPETYVPDEAAGETAETLWVNEMWEGTRIGEDIDVAVRPCLVQFNSISNPSRCHAGIVGTVYNVNEMLPYSLVDMMKKYNYMYDAVHAKLVELIATNWGKLLELDLALKPKNWKVEQWMYFARANKTLIKDSFNEGTKGAATGKLAGGLNNASKGVVDADWGQSIQNYINILEWTKEAMSDLVGINRQREGQTYSRETVGGIERAVLQSSYITDWLFQQHNDTKRRVLECFLEVAKGAMRGGSKKFQYILSDGSRKIMEIPGDEFCECDYGIVMDDSEDTQKLEANIDTIAQAAMQNQGKLSTIMRLFTAASIQEKIRLVEKDEKETAEQQAAQQQQLQQLEQQKLQIEAELRRAEMQQKDLINQRDNQTKIDVAEVNARAEYLRLGIYENQNNEELRREELDIDREKLRAEIEQFDKELRLKEKELDQKKEIELKKIAKTNKTK